MEITDFNSNQPEEQQSKRPEFLSILCILSYIWSGLVLLILLLCLLSSGFIYETLTKIADGSSEFGNMDATQQQAIETLLKLGKGTLTAIIAFMMIVYMTSLLGVYKMWRQQKWGFYIYTVINGLGAVYGIIGGSFFMPIISIAFIAMYAANLKHMR